METIAVLLLKLMLVCAVVGLFAKAASTLLEKNGLNKSTKQLDECKRNHNVTVSYISLSGYMAFCDEEQMLYMRFHDTAKYKEIPYDNIIFLEDGPLGSIVTFRALTPTYDQYSFGSGEESWRPGLQYKLKSIIADNTARAESEYAKIATMPANAVCVPISFCSYSGLPNIPSNPQIHMWDEGDTLYLLPAFDLLNFRKEPEIYKLITIKKSRIICVTQNNHFGGTAEVNIAEPNNEIGVIAFRSADYNAISKFVGTYAQYLSRDWKVYWSRHRDN